MFEVSIKVEPNENKSYIYIYILFFMMKTLFIKSRCLPSTIRRLQLVFYHEPDYYAPNKDPLSIWIDFKKVRFNAWILQRLKNFIRPYFTLWKIANFFSIETIEKYDYFFQILKFYFWLNFKIIIIAKKKEMKKFS